MGGELWGSAKTSVSRDHISSYLEQSRYEPTIGEIMNKHTVVVLLSAVYVAAGASFAQDTKPRFSITIGTPNSAVEAGSDVRLDITLTNLLERDILVGKVPRQGQAEITFAIDVRDSEGKEPVETEYGSKVHGKSKGPFGLDVTVWTTRLKPGEKLQDYSILSHVYDLSVPGTYTISAHRIDVESKTVVKSNVVTVDVTKQAH
jgi:hypothetical protein